MCDETEYEYCSQSCLTELVISRDFQWKIPVFREKALILFRIHLCSFAMIFFKTVLYEQFRHFGFFFSFVHLLTLEH